ncbi:MAG: DUF4178 domain-containing protein [Acidobacteriota bacterium]
MAFEASCPSCGGTVAFKTNSAIVVVCDYCNSVIARGDKNLQNLGKVADLADTGSPLDIGLTGVYQGVPFQLTGRAQLGHEAGGVWDEWYAFFADGRWGWLAEAQGKFYMTFQRPIDPRAIPPFEMLQLGHPVPTLPSPVPLVVGEKGVATMLGAKGEIPYQLIPGERYYFADLSGARGEFATLDYSEIPALFFVGREVPYEQLGFPVTARAPEREAQRVAAKKLNCPQCGGPLECRAPDITERIACPNCGSLLDVKDWKFEYFKALKPGRVVPIIPMGAAGNLSGAQFTVIGFLQRSVTFDKKYYWEEYLLYNPQVGYRWLVRSDEHWNFVQPVPLGDILDSGRNVRFGNKNFRIYQDTPATVEYIVGEFYWKVTYGEKVQAADFIAPPLMLSREISVNPSQKGAMTGEVNWSLGTYLNRQDVEKAFGISGLPKPSTIAPNQPFPHKKVYKYWGIFLLLILILLIGFAIAMPSRQVFEQSFALEPIKSLEDSQVRFTEPFALKGGQNVRVSAFSDVANTWVDIQGDIINNDTNESQDFSLPVEYYSGVDDGEAWSEGNKNVNTYLSAMPAGNYVLGLDVRWEKFQQPVTITVKVEQNVFNGGFFIMAGFLLSIIPVIVMIRHFSFSSRRWKDSDFSPYQSSS